MSCNHSGHGGAHLENKSKFFCHGIAACACVDKVNTAVPVTTRACACSVWDRSENEWRSFILHTHLPPCSIGPILALVEQDYKFNAKCASRPPPGSVTQHRCCRLVCLIVGALDSQTRISIQTFTVRVLQDDAQRTPAGKCHVVNVTPSVNSLCT
jgi:hypothetical protein